MAKNSSQEDTTQQPSRYARLFRCKGTSNET